MDTKKRVFLSHSSHDGVLARLVADILERKGIECFFSARDIQGGEEFDSVIVTRIHACNVLLVLWSVHAAASSWVNQEVGIALAKEIPVWPLVVDDTAIQGAIFRRQGSRLSAHADPVSELERLAEAIGNITTPHDFKPHVDQYVLGKVERTRRLVELLKEEKKTRGYVLRMQAAFSSFGISPDAAYRVAGYHSLEYHELLVEELQEVLRIAGWATVKVILWPQRAYEDSFMKVRFRNLLGVLEKDPDSPRMRFVIGRYHGGNRYILNRRALVGGVKTPGSDRPGYDLTTVTFHGPTIVGAINDFDTRFEELWKQHASACGADPAAGHRAIRSHVIRELLETAPARTAMQSP